MTMLRYAPTAGTPQLVARVPAGSRTVGPRMPVVLPSLVNLLALGTAATINAVVGWPAAGYVAAVLALLAAGGHQRPRICLRVSDQVPRLLGAAVLALPLLLPFTPAGAALRLVIWSAGLLVVFQAVFAVLRRAAHRRGRLVESVLLVGAGALGVRLAELLCAHPEFGLRPCGFLDDRPPLEGTLLPLLAQPAELASVVIRYRIRRVIVCFPADRDDQLVSVLRAGRALRVDMSVVPRLYELGAAVPRFCLDEIWGIPLIPVRRKGIGTAGKLTKRAFDLIAGGLLLILLAPLLLGLAVAIRLRSGSPALFRQLRVTGTHKVASILKLRTLPAHSDADTRWSVPLRRCTPLGLWLRTTHLDELPQLMNVLRGEMSLVGPRPERPYFTARFAHEIPHYVDRQRMPAGITGWAQVHGLHGNTSIVDRVQFDNQYIEYWSPWLDLVILVRTLTSALKRGDSN